MCGLTTLKPAWDFTNQTFYRTHGDHFLWDVSRRFGRFNLHLEGSNLTNSQYQEIRGVEMPGRWLRKGLDVAGL